MGSIVRELILAEKASLNPIQIVEGFVEGYTDQEDLGAKIKQCLTSSFEKVAKEDLTNAVKDFKGASSIKEKLEAIKAFKNFGQSLLDQIKSCPAVEDLKDVKSEFEELVKHRSW